MARLASLLPFVAGPNDGWADLYLEESSRRFLRWEDGRLDEITQTESAGVGWRRLENGETRFISMDARRPVTEGLAADERAKLVKLLPRVKRGLRLPALRTVTRKHPVALPTDGATLAEKAAWLKNADRAARLDPAIQQVSVSYSDMTKRVICLGRDGSAYVEERPYMVFVVQATAERGGMRQTGYEIVSGLGGLELLQAASPETLARTAAKRALAKLDAPPAPLGEMAVVISSVAGGTLIHEAIGHALEADAIQDGSSPHFANKVGKVVANEKVSVLDDPTRAGHRGSFYHDDEGTASERTVLVENGVLRTYLYDRRTAAKDGRVSNGHGRRESYAHKPIPRMSNTFIAAGKDDPEKILKELNRGLFVTRMGGGQVNTTTGDFVFEVEEGFWVENGRVKNPVRGANLLGSGPEVLRTIDRVGRDLGWSVGTCGKEGQGVPVSDGVPTLRIPKVVVGGPQG